MAGLFMLFRREWLGPGRRSIGDDGDGAVLVATLEHWFRVSTGQDAAWLSPGWFWPAANTVSYTDTYALMALPYAAGRAMGFDPSASYDGVVAVLATAGFWSFVRLARRLGSGMLLSAAFAFVFAFGSLATFKLGHGQTYMVMLAPALGLLLLAAWRQRRPWAAAAWTAAAGVLYGLLMLTAPQTAWFLGFDAALAALVAAIACLVPAMRPSRPGPARRLAALALGGAAGLAAGLAPVVVVYRDTIAGRVRGWDEVQAFMPRLTDIVNVQPGNVLWHHLLYLAGVANLSGRPATEVALGFTPGVLVAATVGTVLAVRMRRDGTARALALGALLAPALAWLLTVEVGGISAWHAVYDHVPGADGIRTPFRVQLPSLFFLCLGAAVALSPALEAARLAGRRWPRRLAAALVCLCAAEQAGPGPTTRDAGAMRRWMDAAHRPGFACDVFYLLPQAHPALPWFIRQADAMLLTQVAGMPTVNGLSSWQPPGWDLSDPDSPGYAAAVLAWAATHGNGASFCGADPRSRRWEAGLPPLPAGTAAD